MAPFAASRAHYSGDRPEVGAHGWNIDQWRDVQSSQYLPCGVEPDELLAAPARCWVLRERALPQPPADPADSLGERRTTDYLLWMNHSACGAGAGSEMGPPVA